MSNLPKVVSPAERRALRKRTTPQDFARDVAQAHGLTWLNSWTAGGQHVHDLCYYDPAAQWYLKLQVTGSERYEIEKSLAACFDRFKRVVRAWAAIEE